MGTVGAVTVVVVVVGADTGAEVIVGMVPGTTAVVVEGDTGVVPAAVVTVAVLGTVAAKAPPGRRTAAPPMRMLRMIFICGFNVLQYEGS
jgi:hypothetical protein